MSPRTRDNWPRCEHKPRLNRVTNLPDTIKWENGMSHASAWVCGERACVLDAMAWVERSTSEPAYVYGTLSELGQAVTP